MTAPDAGPIAVIDTNVWLDLFVFADPRVRGLAHALAVGTALTAVRCCQTDAEIEAVLRRPRFAARRAAGPVPGSIDLDEPMLRWRQIAQPRALGAPAPWLCRDRDDQKFLDLAFASGAALLLTKDKALLCLNRKSRRDGLSILTPGQFELDFPQYRPAQGERIVQRMVAP